MCVSTQNCKTNHFKLKFQFDIKIKHWKKKYLKHHLCLSLKYAILRQEIDEPQNEQLEFISCGQILQDEEEKKLSPAQIRDHIFLILEVKETFLTTHVQKGSMKVKMEGTPPSSR